MGSVGLLRNAKFVDFQPLFFTSVTLIVWKVSNVFVIINRNVSQFEDDTSYTYRLVSPRACWCLYTVSRVAARQFKNNNYENTAPRVRTLSHESRITNKHEHSSAKSFFMPKFMNEACLFTSAGRRKWCHKVCVCHFFLNLINQLGRFDEFSSCSAISYWWIWDWYSIEGMVATMCWLNRNLNKKEIKQEPKHFSENSTRHFSNDPYKIFRSPSTSNFSKQWCCDRGRGRVFLSPLPW